MSSFRRSVERARMKREPAGVVTRVPIGDLTLACRHINPDDPEFQPVHVIKLEGAEIAFFAADAGDDVAGATVCPKWVLYCQACWKDFDPDEPVALASQHFSLPYEVVVTGVDEVVVE